MSLALQLERALGVTHGIQRAGGENLQMAIYDDVTGVFVGRVVIKPVDPGSLKHGCGDLVLKLRERVFGQNVPKTWAVMSGGIERKYHGKGFGIATYEKVLKAVAPGIFVPDACRGGGTSPMAMRVWKSLARKYPSESGGGLTVVAVK